MSPPPPTQNDNNRQEENKSSSSSTSTYTPPFDVRWHNAALQKIAPTNQRIKGEAEQAVNNVLGSMRSPLSVVPAPCEEEHTLLLTCIDEARKNTDGAHAKIAKGVEQNALFRQRLTLASETHSKRHADQIEEMSKNLPDEMPRSRLGALVQPCYKRLQSFKKCVDLSVGDWYSHLTKVHDQSQQQQQHQN